METLLGNENDVSLKIEKLVNYKISLLDEYITFNRGELGIDFYIDLHYYLFADIYDFAGKYRSTVNKTDEQIINIVLNKLDLLCKFFTDENYEEIINILIYLKDYQIFMDGNKRTIFALIKWLKCVYNLPLELPDYIYEEVDNINKESIKLKNRMS